MMKRLLINLQFSVLCSFLAIGLSAGHAQALTFPLDKVLTHQGIETGYDFGDVSLTAVVDGAIQIRVDLDTKSDYVDENTYVKFIALNYEDGSDFNTYNFDVTSGSVLNNENKVKMGPFPYSFDLKIKGIKQKDTDNNVYSTILSADVDLIVDNFLFWVGEPDAKVWVALRLGGLSTDINGKHSAWVGDSDPTYSIPTPLIPALLGPGLICLVVFRRKYKK